MIAKSIYAQLINNFSCDAGYRRTDIDKESIMKYTKPPASYDQDNVQKKLLACAKDRVVTILWAAEGFQLIDHIKCNQLKDCTHKGSHSCDADYTINLALFITDADDHSFFSDGTHFEGVRFKLIENFRVKFPNLFGGDEGCIQEIPSVVLKDVLRPDMIKYVRKYIHKATICNLTPCSGTAAL